MSVFGLKMIAIVTMCIDHFAAILGNSSMDIMPYNIMVMIRIIGRIAFPIFIFLIANGYLHTRSKLKYLIGMMKFAVISQVAYSIAFANFGTKSGTSENVINVNFQTLSINIIIMALIGVAIVYLIKKHKHLIIREKEKPKKNVPGTVSVLNVKKNQKEEKNQIEVKEIFKMLFIAVIYFLLPTVTLILNNFVIIGGTLNIYYTLSIGIFSIYILDSFIKNSKIENALLIIIYLMLLITMAPNVDYGVIGVIFVLVMFLCKKTKASQSICLFIFSFLIYRSSSFGAILNPYVLSTIFAIPLIIIYNGKIGPKINKNFFYVFYPVHIIILAVLEMIFNALQTNVLGI